jgi:hypothetical protein
LEKAKGDFTQKSLKIAAKLIQADRTTYTWHN